MSDRSIKYDLRKSLQKTRKYGKQCQRKEGIFLGHGLRPRSYLETMFALKNSQAYSHELCKSVKSGFSFNCLFSQRKLYLQST